jgi:hypothetical protein
MPGPLTWREVAAPTFSGEQEGFQNFGNLITQAFTAARQGLATVDKGQSDAVNAKIMAQIAGARDEEAARQVAASLAGNPNVDRISADTFKQAMGRPADLLAEAVTHEQLVGDKDTNHWNAFVHAQGEKDTNARVAARPLVSQLLQAGTMQNGEKDSSGAVGRINQIMSNPDNAALVAALPEEDQVKLRTNPLEYSSKVLANDQAGLNIRTGNWELSDRQHTAAVQREAAQIYAMVGSMASNADDARALVASSKASPEAKAAAYQLLNGQFPGLVGTADATTGAPSGSSGGGSGSGSVTVGDVATPENANAVISAAKALGAKPEDLATVISYETGGKFDTNMMGGKGGNYQGLIQFGPAERAKYGIKAGMTIPQQMNAVVKYLQDRGYKPGMGIEDLYSTINAGAPGRPNASDGNGTVRQHVAKMLAEHSANAKAFLAAAGQNTFGANPGATSITDVQAAIGQQGSQSIASQWFSHATPEFNAKDPGTVVDELRASGPFKGTAANYLLTQIRQIMDATGGNATQASDILKQSLVAGHANPDWSSGRNLVPRALDFIRGTPNLPNGRKLDRSRVNQLLGEVTSPEAIGNAENQNRLGRGAVDLATAQASLDALTRQYAAMLQKFQGGDRRLAHPLRTLQDQLDIAKARRDAIVKQQQLPTNRYTPKGAPPSFWDQTMSAIGLR